MNRRTYLGSCAGAGLVALAGCLDAVAGRVTRTAATPAFLLAPPGEKDAPVRRSAHLLRALDSEIDSGNPALGTVRVRGWLTGSQLRTANYNNTRSNRSGVRSTDDDSDGDGDDGTERANNHNTTRSNRINPVRGEGDGSDETIDIDRALAYLDPDDDGDGVPTADAPVVGETFVVTAPVVDLPGVSDPAAAADHADYVKNMVTGARAASPTSEETVLRDLTTPTLVRGHPHKPLRPPKEVDKASPLLFTSTAGDDDEPFRVADPSLRFAGESEADSQSGFAVGRAVATLDGGVRLPVLVFAQRLIHGGDHVFVAGWVLDESRLFTNATTVLSATGRTPMLGLRAGRGNGEALEEVENATGIAVDTPTDGQVYLDGEAEGICPGPDHCGFGSDAGEAAGLDAARASLDGRDPDRDDELFLFWIQLDGPLAHFDGDGDYRAAWRKVTTR
ncbi:hypothetical protein [Haloglomus litoreum]|uniref:hypothetical protein n=1 Tax=Haloglomus litoreum TaxID=3034026 RepID=UPI0023E76D8D|nr:hypothetical protein [Haloglomus sp. DT116]